MKKAFTLVELLMAVLLLTLLIGTALFAYRQVLINIKKINTTSINEVLKSYQLRSSIESMQYYVVDDYDMFDTPMQRLHYFFNGAPYIFSYITLNPLFSNIPSVVKIDCTKDKLLSYMEEPLYERIDFKNPKVLKDSKKMILWSNIKDCEFSYLTKTKTTDNLKRDIPRRVNISFINDYDVSYSFAIDIKSDYNISKDMIHAYIYSYE